MSRAVKFRAWHKLRKRMYSVTGLSYSHTDGSLSHVSIRWPADVDPRVTEVVPIDEVELMQFTGLLDRHDKEICECDVVYSRDIDIIGSVSWVEHGLGFTVLSPYPREAYVLHTGWEVIGNIYAQPHLVGGGATA